MESGSRLIDVSAGSLQRDKTVVSSKPFSCSKQSMQRHLHTALTLPQQIYPTDLTQLTSRSAPMHRVHNTPKRRHPGTQSTVSRHHHLLCSIGINRRQRDENRRQCFPIRYCKAHHQSQWIELIHQTINHSPTSPVPHRRLPGRAIISCHDPSRSRHRRQDGYRRPVECRGLALR